MKFACSSLGIISLCLALMAAVSLWAQTRDLALVGTPTIAYADDHSAVIAWKTNAPSSSRVWYGTVMNNLTQLAEAKWGETDHKVRLDGLRPDTTYYFQVESEQGAGPRGDAESQGVLSFRTVASGSAPRRDFQAGNASNLPSDRATGAVRITNGPIIESVGDTSATIAWSTNVKGSSRVNYGTDRNNLTQLGESRWGAGGLTHRVELHNLQPSTTYYFEVETGQAEGNRGEVESQKVESFRTLAAGQKPEHNQKPR